MMQSHKIDRPTDISRYDLSGPAPTSTPASAASLPEPMELSGDMGLELTALVTKMANERKRSGRETRAADEKALDTAERGQLSEMRNKADHMRSEATYELVAGLATAAGKGAAGVCTIEGAGFVASEGANSAAAKSLTGEGALYEAGGEALSAGLKAGASSMHSKQALDDVAIAAKEQAAGHAKRAADDARDEIRDGGDLERKAIEFYREFTSAQNQAQSAALHRS
jgi:hypothetical protein